MIANDRLGHGRSGQTWGGSTMDQHVDDLAKLIEHLYIKKIMIVRHSTGGGEGARYIGRHGNKRAKKVVFISAVPPITDISQELTASSIIYCFY